MEVTRTFDLLKKLETKFPKKDILGGKQNGEWRTYSTQEYIEIVNNFSYGLLSLGFNKGDKIATISNNRPEWNFVDFAMAQTGIIHVPIYPTISQEEYKYILKHAEVKAVIVSNKSIYKKIEPIVKKIRRIKTIYSFDKITETPYWKEILQAGIKSKAEYSKKLTSIRESISKDDLVTIIYTSGTTGQPKGVMLSHNNLISNVINTSKAHKLGSEHRAISFLPLCHVYERMMVYHFHYKGISIYYAENLGTIASDIKEIKPHIFNTVPRLLEKVYDTIIGKGKTLPFIKKAIFFWAVNLGLKFQLNKKRRPWYNLKLKIARILVFNKWKEALGNNIKVIVSGGASLQKRIEHVFWAAGIPIIEGYGLTETSPVIATNRFEPLNAKLGTVGPVLEDVKVKINEEGEILCKGPNVMLGYYKEPKLTQEVLDKEGWFHTGDIGHLDKDNFLIITDRKKAMFKTSGGKYIAPQVIENKLKESFFIEQAMVIGENEKFAAALISPNFEFLHDWCSVHKIQFRDNLELVNKPEVMARYQKEINKYNQKLGETEKIKRFKLVCEEWNSQTGELSPTQKLKREVIYNKYQSLIDEIYRNTRENENNKLADISRKTINGIKNSVKNGIDNLKTGVPKI
ncbi:MAG: long-chain fatty acid--CoA ligase [Bacteroidales bacterium]